ncbi:ParB/RepB/Spo0J family partition protein [Desulfosoma caldarium]|uniref:ParB family chromosome partitioning protein n=1 Tax=Desulfosoma caldarium TaxID=610254 RepID=A0A3N1VL73_9BACT|nr:ParB/RepB/Spo0J family partition protein [Desulfosoma caldarium]ROR03543.1 ParB family chromosome partitioning protein [Desulfosoma caldarium]
MAEKRKGLGRGLQDLLPSTDWLKREEVQVFYCPVERLRPNPYQPRQKVEDEAFRELVDSVRENGILQPILVSRGPEQETYTIVAGERRWQAARAAGLREVPVVVREATPREALELALVENLQRQDLNCIEQAAAYRRLHDEFGLTQAHIAQRVGKDRSTVANIMRLTQLPLVIQEDLLDGRLTMGHARALLALPDDESRLTMRDAILRGQLSVRQTEKRINFFLQGKKRSEGAPPRSRWQEMEKRLRQHLNLPVTVRRQGESGTVTIAYRDAQQLQTLLRHLGVQDAGDADDAGS